MNYLRTIIIVLMLICIPFSASWAQSSVDKHQELDEQIIETLALSHRIVYLAKDFKGFLKHNPFPQSDEMNKQALTAYQKAYNHELLMKDFEQIFSQKISNLPHETLRSWLNKASTKKLAQARQKYYTLQGKRKRIVALYELAQDSLSAERRQLLATYANERTPEELLLDTRTVVLVSAIKKIDQFNSQIDIPRSRMDMLAKQTRQNPNDIKQHRQKVLKVMFYGIPSKTVQESLHFWQSKTGKSLTKTIFQSLKQAYKKAAQRLSQSSNQSDN